MSQGGMLSGSTAIPGLVVLQTKTATNQALVVFTDITSAYRAYKLLVTGLQVVQGGGTYLRLRCSTNGGVSYDSGNNYSYSNFYHGSDSSNDWTRASAQSGIILVLPIPESATSTDNGTIDLNMVNLSSATQYKIFSGQTAVNHTTTSFDAEVSASYNLATAVNAIQFDTNNGANIFAGTFTLYGIA